MLLKPNSSPMGHPCKLSTLKKKNAAPWHKNLVGYTCLHLKYDHVKTLKTKNGCFLLLFFFFFTFL